MAESGGAEAFASAERPPTPNIAGGGGGSGGGGGGSSSMADKSSTLKCTFSAPGHSATLLHGLASLRAQAQLLDVILTINNEVFQVHKVVLAACSDYFRTELAPTKSRRNKV